jgi:hypothetical protein
MAKKIKLTNGDDTFKGSGKDEIINARDGDDSVSGGGGNDTINGGDGNDFLRGGAGDDTLNGGVGDDRLLGGDGDDTINGGAGVNVVDGGLGDDLVVLDGNFADAKITATADGFKIVTAGGETTVKNVESFQFADGVKGADELLPGAGKTFVLTVPIDNIIGTSGDDTIVGDNASFTADVIAGGDGKDVLKVATATAATNGTPTMTGVERVEVTGSSTAGFTTTLNLVNTTGVTSFALNSGSQNATLTSVKGILDLEVANTTAGTLAVTYDAAAVAGTADTQKVSVNNAVLTGLTVNGAETVAITTAGTANNLGTVTDAAAKAITVSGAGNLTFATAATSTALTSIDASAATGKINLTLGSATDVAVKTGGGDDTINFGATFTSKDTVDAGAGKDTVALAGGDFSLATNDTLVGLNKLTGVETLRFTSGATTIDRATLTNATIATFAFDNGSTAVLNNAKTTDMVQIGATADVTSLTYGGTSVPSTVNVELAGTPAVAGTNASDDADVGGIAATTATAVNIVSTAVAKDINGVAVASGIGDGDNAWTDAAVNDIYGAINVAANAVVKITGDGHVGINTAFTNAVTLDASGLTGDLWTVGSAQNDTIKGGSGTNEITAGAGADTIDISASAGKIDYIHIEGIVSSANRDVITGFKAGAGGDRFGILTTETYPSPTAANAAPTWAEKTTTGALDLTAVSPASPDIFEFNVSTVGTSLGDGSASSLNGTNLFVAEGLGASFVVNSGAAGTEAEGYLIAYQGGNAYVYYYFDADFNDAVVATEVNLVAEVKGVTVGALTADNFDFTA